MLKQKRSNKRSRDNSNSYMTGEFDTRKTPEVFSELPKIAKNSKRKETPNLLLKNIYKCYIYTVNNARNL